MPVAGAAQVGSNPRSPTASLVARMRPSASEMKTHTGAGRLGIEKVSGFAGRGVMLDFPKLKGVPWLEPGTMITAADLDAAEQAQGVTVGSGDIVLLRTQP